MQQEEIKISKAEWEVMEVLWQDSPLSATEVFQNLDTQVDRHIKTIRTLLDRLVAKGALEKRKVHGMNVFEPIVERQHCLHREGRSFIDQYFGGDSLSGVAYFIEQKDLSEEELSRLRDLLEKKRSARKKRR